MASPLIPAISQGSAAVPLKHGDRHGDANSNGGGSELTSQVQSIGQAASASQSQTLDTERRAKSVPTGKKRVEAPYKRTPKKGKHGVSPKEEDKDDSDSGGLDITV
ncbi:MAG: hypothetical protein D6808_03000 [Candidatus Dadabacteria bacterium]|nr:MAG: hypothetical protein D6808_03000 [Candidatus Dadabacteria bacterium]